MKPTRCLTRGRQLAQPHFFLETHEYDKGGGGRTRIPVIVVFAAGRYPFSAYSRCSFQGVHPPPLNRERMVSDQARRLRDMCYVNIGNH